MALSTRELLLVLRARDEASRVLRGFAGTMRGISAQAHDAAMKSYAHGQALVTGGVAVAGAGVLAVAALNEMTNAAIEYNQEAAKTLTQVDGVKIGLEELKAMGREVGADIPVQFDQIQGALYDIFSSIETDAPGAAILLRGIGKAAVAGAVDMEVAGRTNIGILNAWGMEARDVHHVNDVMFQLVRKGVGTYDQFGKAIGRAVPSAVKAGQSVESLAGMMAFLTRNGLSTAMSATSAARALDAMSNSKTVSKFKEWGVNITDAQGKFRPMVTIIQEMNEKLRGLSPSAKAAKLQELFKGSGGTIQAMRFFNLALNDSNGLLKTLTKDMHNAGGASDEAYKIMANTPQAKIQLMNNQWQIMQTLLGDHLVPIKMKVVALLSKIFGWFNNLSPSTQAWIVKVAALAAGLAILLGVVGAAIGLFMMFQAAVVLAGFTMGTVIAVAAGVVAGIAAIIAIGVLVYKNWDLIKASAINLWNNVKQVFAGMWTAISEFAAHVTAFAQEIWQVIGPGITRGWNKMKDAVIAAFSALKPHWDAFVAAILIVQLRAQEIGSGIAAIFSWLFDIIKPILFALAGVFQILWSVISEVFSAILNTVVQVVGNVLDIFRGLIDFFVNIFTGNFRQAFEALDGIVKNAWELIVDLFLGARDIIWGIVEGFIKGVIDFFKNLFNVLVGNSIVPDLIKAIIKWFSQLPGKVTAFVIELVVGVIKWFTNLGTQAVAKVIDLKNRVVSWFGTLKANAITKASELVSGAVRYFSELPGKAINTISSLPGKMQTQGSKWLQSALEGLRSIWPAVSNFFDGLPTRILNALGNLGSMLWSAGRQILQGFLDGLRSMWGDVQNFVGGIGSWIASHKGPREYDLNLLVPAGRWIMTGLRHGLKREIPSLLTTLGAVSDMIAQQMFTSPPVVFGSTGAPVGVGIGPSGTPGASTIFDIDVHTQELDPAKQSADLGYLIAGRLGL